ncbi:MAG: hypothetical protein AB7G93_14775 [Bdellovibrionales bacterium]
MRRILAFGISLGLASAGCESTPSRETHPEDYSQAVNCTGGPECAVVAGILLVFATSSTPAAHHTKHLRRNTLFGRCELSIEDESSATKPEIRPCEQVLLTLRPSGGTSERKAWIDGTNFEIPGLAPVAYDVEVFSEKYQAQARLSEVHLDRFLEVQLKLKRRYGH